MKNTILLIDDDPIAHMISKRVISRSYPDEIIKEFLSASLVVEFLENLTHPNHFCFIIFLDINMPGLNGWDFTEIMEKKFSSLDYRIHLLTSSVNEKDKIKAQTYDKICSFIAKPFSIAKLEELDL